MKKIISLDFAQENEHTLSLCYAILKKASDGFLIFSCRNSLAYNLATLTICAGGMTNMKIIASNKQIQKVC